LEPFLNEKLNCNKNSVFLKKCQEGGKEKLGVGKGYAPTGQRPNLSQKTSRQGAKVYKDAKEEGKGGLTTEFWTAKTGFLAYTVPPVYDTPFRLCAECARLCAVFIPFFSSGQVFVKAVA